MQLHEKKPEKNSGLQRDNNNFIYYFKMFFVKNSGQQNISSGFNLRHLSKMI